VGNLRQYYEYRIGSITEEPMLTEAESLEEFEEDYKIVDMHRPCCFQHHRTINGRLHWDFRMLVDGVAKSWALPKGWPRSGQKRLAIMTEDHPQDYLDYEGTITKGRGAGVHVLTDRGLVTGLEWMDNTISFKVDMAGVQGGVHMVHPKNWEEKSNWLFFFKGLQSTEYPDTPNEPGRQRLKEPKSG